MMNILYLYSENKFSKVMVTFKKNFCHVFQACIRHTGCNKLDTNNHLTFSRTTRVSRYQKGKTNLDFTGARDSEWQWHQLGYMQVCTSLQTDNHASTPPLCFYRPDALPAAQPTASKHKLNKHSK